jgi:hypothetical protein
MRPGQKGAVITIDGGVSDWRGLPALYSASAPQANLAPPLRLMSLSVAHDEAYVYLRLDVARIDWTRAHYQVGIDTYSKNLGDTRLPNTGSKSPVGLEFVLDIGGPASTQLLVDHPYNPYRRVIIPGSKPAVTQYVYNRPFKTVANDAGQWDSVVVVPNRRRISRDGRIYPAMSYSRNRLLHAMQTENSIADWYSNSSTGVIEVRLPWAMLQVADPSSRSVLFGVGGKDQITGAAITDGFRFVVESYDPTNPESGADRLPQATRGGGFNDPPNWTWPTWEIPNWHAELKPLFGAMQRTFAAIPDHPTTR